MLGPSREPVSTGRCELAATVSALSVSDPFIASQGRRLNVLVP